jgi:hypothetical protein
MGFLFYIVAISHNLTSNFTKSLGVALIRALYIEISGHYLCDFPVLFHFIVLKSANAL